MICPYCNNKIPDGSIECFVCGEDLLPKATSEYYTDMDAVKKEDAELYDNLSKDMGIKSKHKYTNGQMIALMITGIIAFILILIALDIPEFIRCKVSSNYEEREAAIVGLHYISYNEARDTFLSTDCIIVYEFNGEFREEQVKAGFHYNFGDIINIYIDMDGNPYHFVFSLGDLLQLIIISSITAVTVIAIIKWHVMPNADGHLNRRMPAIIALERRNPGMMSKNRKWWRYY